MTEPLPDYNPAFLTWWNAGYVDKATLDPKKAAYDAWRASGTILRMRLTNLANAAACVISDVGKVNDDLPLAASIAMLSADAGLAEEALKGEFPFK